MAAVLSICAALIEIAIMLLLNVILHFVLDIYGYHQNKKVQFLKITMSLQRLIAPAKRLLGDCFSFPGGPVHSYQSYESNIDIEIRSVTIILFNTLYLR